MGGSNSIKEAISFNVPLLVYPDRAEQPGIAARIVYHGIGKRGNLRQDSPEEIAEKIKQLLTDSTYYVNNSKMKRIFELDQDRNTVVKIAKSLIEQR